jgi:hypothetical protein
MYKITMVHTRPNIETAFHRRSTEVIEKATEAKLNGKLLSEESTLSDDKLSTTYVAVWDNVASFDAFSKETDVVTFRIAKTEHNRTNGIVQNVNKQETI